MAGVTLLTACDNALNETDYTYSISSETFYNTVEEANAAVLAPLDAMRSAYNSNFFATLEINTEYCYPKGVYQTYKQYNGFVNATHMNRRDSNWQSLYKAIMFCNTAIERIPNATKMTEEEKLAYLGELRFLRGFNYFNLVKYWGGVPLKTDKNITEWNIPKSSKEEVYNFIIEDLKYALDNCPDKKRYLATPDKNTVRVCLADVYMHTGDYIEAKKLSGEVVNSGTYQLVQVAEPRDFDKVFGADLTTSTEEIFYIKTSRIDGKTWDYLSYTSHPKYEFVPGKTMLNGNGYYTHYTDLRNHIIKSWDTNDLRYGMNIGFYVFGKDAYGEYTCLLTKYTDPNAQGNGANVSIPLIRYTDAMLIYSEACARVANTPTMESIEMLNQLRRRAYGKDPKVPNAELDYKLSDYASMTAYMDLLLKEETYEHFNEAKHWDFIVRQGRAQELVGKYFNVETGEYTQIQERHYLWKIPDSEFNYNKAMDQVKDQNPGYTSSN